MRIPLLSTPDKPISATTQSDMPVADIADDLVLFKNGSVALIMESTSLNFGLLSEREQQAVIASYAGLLNSLGFPIQIVVRSQIKDISNYIKTLDDAAEKITNPKLRKVMTSYKKFIYEAIKKKNVLSKKFYIVIPFSQYELGITKSFVSTFSPKRGPQVLPYTKNYILKKAKISLYPKRDHVIRQSKRLGLLPKQLTTDELTYLVYDLYNPSLTVNS